MNGLWSTLPIHIRLRVFGVMSLIAFGMSYWVSITGEVLRTTVGPLGIVSLELAGTPVAAQLIYAAWGASGMQAARFNIGIDFLYLLSYGIALSVGCSLASVWWARRSLRMAGYGGAMSIAVLVAAICDAVENVAMLRSMQDVSNPLWPTLAKSCAIVKFSLLLPALLYLMTGAFTRIGTRNRPGQVAPPRP